MQNPDYPYAFLRYTDRYLDGVHLVFDNPQFVEDIGQWTKNYKPAMLSWDILTGWLYEYDEKGEEVTKHQFVLAPK